MLDKFYKSFKVFICFFLIFNTTLLSFSLDSKADTITGDIVGTGTGSLTVETLRKVLGDTGLGQLGIILGGATVMAKNEEYVINPFLDLVKTGLQEFTPGTLTGVLDGLKFKETGVSEFVLSAKGIESILDFMLSKTDTEYSIPSSVTTYDAVNGVLTLSLPTNNSKTSSVVAVLHSTARIYSSGFGYIDRDGFLSPLGNSNIYVHALVNGNWNHVAYNKCEYYLSDSSNFVAFYGNKGYTEYSNYEGVTFRDVNAYTSVGVPKSVTFRNITSADVFSPPSTGVYPSDFSKYQSIDDYNSSHKTLTGSPSICVDWDKLLKGQDLTKLNNVDDVVGALEGVISSPGGADVLGQSISLEYDGVVVPDTPEVTEDDSNPSLLKKLMDWLFDLFKTLAELLEKLLSKLLEGLKDLLLSLFVPSDTFVHDKVNGLKADLEPKLPYMQFTELFNNDYEGSPLKDIYINWQGKEIVIVKVTLFEKFREVFNWGVYAVTFFLLAVYNYNNIYKLIRGTDYVSATGTVKNMSDEGSDKK